MSVEWFDFQTRGQIESLIRQVDGFLNPVGAIQLWAGASNMIPVGWLNCDGSSVLISAYPELYAVIGTAFGSVDGTHFTLPDFGGKFALGVSATNLIGSSGGSKTISTDNLPSHNHPNTSQSTGITATASALTGLSITSTAHLPDHTHNYTRPNASYLNGLPVGAPSMNGTTDVASGGVNSLPISIPISNATNDPSHSHTITDPTHTHTSGVVGGGVDYLQPYTSIFYTICYTAKFPTT